MNTDNTTRVKPFYLGWIYRQQKEWFLFQVRITWQLCKKKQKQKQKGVFSPSRMNTIIVQRPFDPEATAFND
jgi:hypothetical protein